MEENRTFTFDTRCARNFLAPKSLFIQPEVSVMCILFVFTDPAPKEGGYRAIIASNRDEFYRRPARSAYKCERTGVIGGKDLENGTLDSMWLGVSVRQSPDFKFRFGALLNVSGEPKKPDGRARGIIVTDYISGHKTASLYSDELLRIGETFNPFNFVSVELSTTHSEIWYNSNSPIERNRFEGRSVLGFGNSPANTPLQKVVRGRENFENIIDQFNDVARKESLVGELIQLLKLEERFLPDAELKKRLPVDQFEPVSAIYVKFIEAGYGTRTHSVILVDYDWNVEFTESTMTEPIDPNDPSWSTVRIMSQL